VQGLQALRGNAWVARRLARRAVAAGGEHAQRAVAPPAAAPAPAGATLTAQLVALLNRARRGEGGTVDDLLVAIRGTPLEERERAYARAALRQRLMLQLSDGLDLVMAALLEGPPYAPGVASEQFQALGPAAREEVVAQTNHRFVLETGVARALDWDRPDDRPRARRWLVLRDGLTHVRPVHDLYKEKLAEAVDRLRAVPFGRSTGSAVGEAAGDRYDLDSWEEVPEKDGSQRAMLRLKAGVAPSAAVDELFDESEHWAFDCAEFVQAAHLFARRHTVPAEAFDRASRERHGGAMTMLLRSQYSTGLVQARGYQRDAADEAMTRFPEGVPEAKGIDALLAEAPVGSRIVWRNRRAGRDTDFFNENALKLGQDLYAAHGLHRTRRTFSRAELEKRLAGITARTDRRRADAAYIRENIFVRSIERYALP
jgi:hypothetical protein